MAGIYLGFVTHYCTRAIIRFNTYEPSGITHVRLYRVLNEKRLKMYKNCRQA